MEIAFIHLVTLKYYVDMRNNVYYQLTFFMPPSLLFVEILQYDISSQILKHQKIKKILKKTCDMSIGKY